MEQNQTGSTIAKQMSIYLSLYTAGILIFMLSLLVSETDNGGSSLRLFSIIFDIRLPCVVLWMLGISGMFGMGMKRKYGLIVVIMTAFLSMACCIAMNGRGYALILYLAVGILILCARRDGYEIRKAEHAILSLVYFAVPIVFLILEMLNSTYIVRSFLIWADPKTDALGQGSLYLMIKQLLSGAQFVGKSAYASQMGFSPEQLLHNYSNEYAPAELVAMYGWALGIAVLIVLAVLSYVLFRCAYAIADRRRRSIAFGCTLFFAVQLVISAASNFMLLPFIYISRMPFISGSVMDHLFELLMWGIVIYTYLKYCERSPRFFKWLWINRNESYDE